MKLGGIKRIIRIWLDALGHSLFTEEGCKSLWKFLTSELKINLEHVGIGSAIIGCR